MASKAKYTGILKPADKLKPSPSDEIFRRICAWEQVPTMTQAELLGWLFGVCETLAKGREIFLATVEQIRERDEPYRLQQAEIVDTSYDFVMRSKVAAKLLRGEPADRTLDAFTEGVRIGLIHERLMSLIDGRYTEKWLREASRQRGGKNTKELTSGADVLLLKTTYAKYRGEVKAFEKTANELFERHKIKGRRGKKISAKTIGRRLAELEILDNA